MNPTLDELFDTLASLDSVLRFYAKFSERATDNDRLLANGERQEVRYAIALKTLGMLQNGSLAFVSVDADSVVFRDFSGDLFNVDFDTLELAKG